MNKPKKAGLTREQAEQIYSDLKARIEKMEANVTGSAKPAAMNKKVAAAKAKAVYTKPGRTATAASAGAPKVSADTLDAYRKAKNFNAAIKGIKLPDAREGRKAAILFVLAFGAIKIAISALEYSGAVRVEAAQAGLNRSELSTSALVTTNGPSFSKEEVAVLTSLDSRRAELEERNKHLTERQAEFDRKEREFAIKLSSLRELTDKLRNEREKSEKKRGGQIDQLANVYSSMNADEAARLMEQLDVTIALSLLERMPEKKIGQILALMSPEKALMITKFLSGTRPQ